MPDTKQVQVSTPQASKEKILVFPDNELDVAVVYDAEGYNKVCDSPSASKASDESHYGQPAKRAAAWQAAAWQATAAGDESKSSSSSSSGDTAAAAEGRMEASTAAAL